MRILKNAHLAIPLLCVASVAIATRGLATLHEHVPDFAFYQAFTEALASGTLDLSIPGFHGADFIGVFFYLLTKSPLSHFLFQMVSGVLVPFAGYLAASALFNDKRHGVLMAMMLALMPYTTLSYITGYTQTSNLLLFLLAIYGAVKQAKWTGVVWALAILTKPFSVIILPILIAYRSSQGGCIKRNMQIMIGLGLCALYVALQYLQIGSVQVGVHGGTESLVLWDGLRKIVGNAAWGMQSMFSIHNYYYANPANTGHWNLLHTSPVLITLGLFALSAPKTYFQKPSLHRALAVSALFGFVLNSIVSMDNYYMHFFNFMLIFSALPVLLKHRIWILIVALTLHYQWFYFTLEFSDRINIGWWTYTPVIVVDLIIAIKSATLLFR